MQLDLRIVNDSLVLTRPSVHIAFLFLWLGWQLFTPICRSEGTKVTLSVFHCSLVKPFPSSGALSMTAYSWGYCVLMGRQYQLYERQITAPQSVVSTPL